MVDTPRTPVIWRRDVPDASAAQSTLLGSLTALLPAPPPPADPQIIPLIWPNPRGPRSNIPLSWTDKLIIDILPPPGNYDQPNPRGCQRIPQDFIKATPCTLTSVPAVPPPISQEDWPVPRGRRNPQDFVVGSTWLLTQPAPTFPAAQQTDWPVPRVTRRNPQDWIAATNIVLGTAVHLRAPYLWQRKPLVDASAAQSTLLGSNTIPITPVVAPAPFAQTDWPNPRGPKRNPRDWSDSFKLPLQQTLPPTQKNWPLPTPVRKRGPQDWILPVDIALYTTVQIKPPNRQWDWPVPKGPRQPVITTRYYVQGFTPPVAPVYNPDLTLKNEVRRIRFLDNTSGRIRYLKNEIRS